MKINIAKFEPGRIGGGWSFARNFARGMGDRITDYDEANVYFIPSPSMVQREEVIKAKDDGKKVVLRIDNAVRNSRNRNTGMTRMKDFSEWADLIVFQSVWALEYLDPFLKPATDKVCVILNGVDLNIFRHSAGPIDNVLYSRFNRDETKNWEVARYWFSQEAVKNPKARLSIVGQFSDDLRAGNFDFYNNEDYQYYGVLDEVAMAGLYQTCGALLYTYFNDACSNTLIEALACGLKIVGPSYFLTTGGADEIRSLYRSKGREYFSADRMCEEYINAIERIL